MQFIRIWLSGNIILLLQSATNCAYTKFYHVQIVENIKPAILENRPLTPFVNNETCTLFNTDALPIQERWNMCNEASQLVEEDGGYILIAKYSKPDVLRRAPYAVDMVESENDPKSLEGFACPTRPAIYLQTTHQNETTLLVISIIIKRRDMQLRSVCVNRIRYVRKLVRKIRLIGEEWPWISNLVYSRKPIGLFYSDPLPNIQRTEMCRRAQMEILADRSVQFVENTLADVERLYMLQSERNSLLYSIVKAFGCSTIPLIYVQVLDIRDESSEAYWVWVIAETAPETAPSVSGPKYQYHLEIVRCITLSTVLRSDNVGEIPEEQRLYMCREAFQEVHQTEGQNVEFLEDLKPGNCELYRILFKNDGKRDDVLAFKCPTKPAVFLAREISQQRVLIFMEEFKFIFSQLGIVGYRLEIITDIVEVTSAELQEKAPSVNVHTSVVGPDCNFPEECRKLCEQTVPYVQNHAKVDVEFLPKTEIGPRRYYVLKTESQNRADKHERRPIAVQAFECPTDPEIYLNVTAEEGTGNIMWIYTRETKRALTLKVVRCETVLFLEISAVSDPESKRRARKSPINTDELSEKRRRRLCHKAWMNAKSKITIKYFENSDTGKLNVYAVDHQSEDGRILRGYVQALKCPTEPAIYLYISDQDDGHVVWILEKIRSSPLPGELYPPVEFLSYEVKLVKNIIEATPEVISMLDISSRLDHLTLDTSTFPGQYFYRLCEKAVKTISDEKVDFLPKREIGQNIFYSVIEFRKDNKEPQLVKAFQCPTDPPLYLQVKQEPGIQAYSVIVFARKSHLIDVRSEFQYLVKFVENITEVPHPVSDEFGSVESSAVDIEFFTKKQRLQMCKEALKRLFLADRSMIELSNGDTMSQKLYSLLGLLHTMDENLKFHTVQAFQCSIEPEVYLELHYWQAEGIVAWIIAKKKEFSRPTEFRDPSTEPLRPKESIGEQQKPKEPIGKPFTEPSRSEESRGSQRSRRPISKPSSDTRRPREDTDTSLDRRIRSYKVKFVEDIQTAGLREIGSTLSTTRERTMVNTDKQYSEDQRTQLCAEAVQMMPEQNVQLFKGLTGKSKLLIVDEGFVVENVPEIKYVRAFECPSEPPIYLEVRHRKYKGRTVTVIMKEMKPLKYSMSFMLKPVDSIKSAAQMADSNTSRHSRSSSIKGKRPTLTNEFSAPKLLQMCKRAWKMVSNRKLKFSSTDPVNASEEYVIDPDLPYSELVHAFKCPCDPPIYLEVHRCIPGEYTVLIIKEPKEYNASLTAFSKEENITYRVKPVTDIRKAPPYRIREILELMPHLENSNMDSVFSESERMLMCRDAMKMFPEIDFQFQSSARRDITRTYILNAESENHQDYVKAFKCPTTPVLHIQLEENEDDSGYTASIIIAQNGNVTSDPSTEEQGLSYSSELAQKIRAIEVDQAYTYYDSNRSLTKDDFSHLHEPQNIAKEDAPRRTSEEFRQSEYPPPELQIVDKIVNVTSIDDPNDYPPPEPVNYDLGQRNRMCEEGRLLVPRNEFIGRIENREPEDHKPYIIYYTTEIGVPREEIVLAFTCPYEPPFIIRTYDKNLRRRVTRVIIMEEMLPTVTLIS